MTDNTVFIDDSGNEMVRVNRSDGLGISEIKKIGIEQIIVSTEKNLVVTERAKKLNLTCMHGIDDKEKTVLDYCKKNNIDLKNVVYVGNDINDKDAMKIVGLTFCPADAHQDIKEISDYVLNTRGGRGVIREMLDIINNKGD